MASTHAQQLKDMGTKLEKYNNNIAKCNGNLKYLKSNTCFSWYFVEPEIGADPCENRHTQYCYSGNLFECTNRSTN